MDASEIYSKRLNAKEVIFPKQGEFTFPIADGRIKTLGGDQELRTSTLVRHRPIQGESSIDFLGESEGSLPQTHDSFPDAGEAINDFWSMSGSIIYRHHVEPRVKLYSLREESFPIPLKYIDLSRATHTNLGEMQERRIDDYWNINGSRDLSDSWTGFTQFSLLEEKPPDGFMWPKSECPDIWIRLPRHKWPKSWSSMEDPFVPLERNLYGHLLAGLLWERQFEKILLKHGWEKIPNWECLFVHREKGLFLTVYKDDIKLTGKKQNINSM